MSFGPPIVWWMDALDLVDASKDQDKLKQIKKRLEEFEETEVYKTLRDDLENIIKS